MHAFAEVPLESKELFFKGLVVLSHSFDTAELIALLVIEEAWLT